MERPSEECSGLGPSLEHQVGEAGLTEVAEHEHLAAVPGQKDQSAAAEHLVGEAG